MIVFWWRYRNVALNGSWFCVAHLDWHTHGLGEEDLVRGQSAGSRVSHCSHQGSYNLVVYGPLEEVEKQFASLFATVAQSQLIAEGRTNKAIREKRERAVTLLKAFSEELERERD